MTTLADAITTAIWQALKDQGLTIDHLGHVPAVGYSVDTTNYFTVESYPWQLYFAISEQGWVNIAARWRDDYKIRPDIEKDFTLESPDCFEEIERHLEHFGVRLDLRRSLGDWE